MSSSEVLVLFEFLLSISWLLCVCVFFSIDPIFLAEAGPFYLSFMKEEARAQITRRKNNYNAERFLYLQTPPSSIVASLHISLRTPF